MTRTIRSFFLVAAVAALLSPAFGRIRPADASLPLAAGRKIIIVATVFPLAEFAREIAGERGEVALLLPPGADVHSWLPRVSDMRKLETADLLVSIGRGLEPWLDALVKGSEARIGARLEAAEGLDLIPAGDENEHDPARGGISEGHDHEGVDPHVWLDFGQDEVIVDALTRKLSQVAPDAGTLFSRNAEALKTRLRGLDVLYRTSLERFRGRSFFVGGHAAFAYLARRYGLVQIAVYGLSPDAGPSPRDMAAAITRARAESVKTVYYEPSSGDKMARLIAAEIRADVRVLFPGHNLNPAQAAEKTTFFQLMERNLENLIHGFAGR